MNKCYSQDAYDKYTENDIAATLTASGGICGGGSAVLIVQYKDPLIQKDKSSTLGVNCEMSTGRNGVCMATQQGGAEIRTDGKAPTLTAAAGMSGNNQPVYCNEQVDKKMLSIVWLSGGLRLLSANACKAFRTVGLTSENG